MALDRAGNPYYTLGMTTTPALPPLPPDFNFEAALDAIKPAIRELIDGRTALSVLRKMVAVGSLDLSVALLVHPVRATGDDQLTEDELEFLQTLTESLEAA